MNNSSGVWKFLGIALVVIVVSLAGGYYFSGGSQRPTTPATTTEQTADATAPAATTSTTPQPHAVAASSEYTAPDAPSIDIKEVKPQPGAKQIAKPADSEASQVGTPYPAPNAANPSTGLITTTGTSQPDSSTPTTTPTEANPPPPPPADSGDGLGPSIPPPVQPPAVDNSGSNSTADSGPIYHVLVGNTFGDSRNAHIYASSLQHRGYIAVVESINSGTGTVYKVQVGAYRNRVTADDQVNQLQQSGFNAYVATDR